MRVDLLSGGKVVLASGSLLSCENEPIEMRLCDIDHPGDDLTLFFNFRQDASVTGMKTTAHGDGKSYTFELVNYNNSLGQGLFRPYLFATTGDGKNLYIVFSVYDMAKNVAKKISYTIYKDC